MKRHFRRRIDERQRADLRRVESYGYWIAFWLLLVSVIVKSVMLGRPKEEWLTEWVIFMILAIYNVVSLAWIGVWSENSPKPTFASSVSSSLLGSLGFSVIFTAGSWLQSGKTMEMKTLILMFMAWFIGLFLVLIAAFAVLMWVYRARYRRLQKQMDAELEEEEHEEL